MNQKTKQILIIIVIIIIAFVGYKMFFSGATPSDVTLVADSGSGQTFVDGQAILLLLNNLNKVTLDESVFSNKTFTSLISFERPIQEQIPGRPNPFLPIGVDTLNTAVPKGASATPVIVSTSTSLLNR